MTLSKSWTYIRYLANQAIHPSRSVNWYRQFVGGNNSNAVFTVLLQYKYIVNARTQTHTLTHTRIRTHTHSHTLTHTNTHRNTHTHKHTPTDTQTIENCLKIITFACRASSETGWYKLFKFSQQRFYNIC